MEAILSAKSIACPACTGWAFSSGGQINGYSVVRCSACGLWMVNPQPTLEALVDYYDHVYYAHPDWIRSVKQETVMRMAAGKVPAFRQTCGQLKRWCNGRRLLDVGCAFGQFIVIAQEDGFVASGVEFNELIAGRARNFGLSVVTGDFLAADLPVTSYDAVTMWYVLEHVVDPVSILCRAYQVLRDDGVLFIRVPNMTFGLPFLRLSRLGLRRLPSILSHIPAHLFFYTPQTLNQLVVAAGFEVLEIEHGLPVLCSENGIEPYLSDAARRMVIFLADALAAVTGKQVLCGPFLSLYARKIA